MDVEEQIEQLRSIRGNFIIPVDSPPIFQWADDAADTIERLNERNKQLEAVLVAAKEWQNTITDVPTTIEAIDVDTALCDAIAAANDRS